MVQHSPHQKSTLYHAVYSFRYAVRVVEAFVESYSRATNFVAKKCGYTPKEFKYKLINIFCYHNPMWNFTREAIKKIEKWEMYDELAGYSKAEFIKYLTVVKDMEIEKWLDT